MSVTIQIPASEPQIQWPEGSPGSVDSLARTLYATAGRYEEFGDLASSARAVPGWYGDAYEAYSGAAGRASGEHATMAATVKRVAHVCSGYDIDGDGRQLVVLRAEGGDSDVPQPVRVPAGPAAAPRDRGGRPAADQQRGRRRAGGGLPVDREAGARRRPAARRDPAGRHAVLRPGQRRDPAPC